MAYQRSNLISRRGYSGMGDFWDSITGAAGSVLKFYGNEQQAVGAQAQAAATNRDLTAALAAQQGGISTETLMIVGAAGLAAFLIFMRKK